MSDACYYALIDRDDDGGFSGWIPDLPGVVASGATEHDVYHRLFSRARQCLHDMIVTGQPLPLARPVAELPQEPTTYRRLLFIIS
jgi:predicted RNase H-like HicB family nuclease